MKKIQYIIIFVLICVCVILIVTNELNVEASGQKNGNVGLDYDFIYNDVIKNLSFVIYDQEYGIDQDIWKGRCFGTGTYRVYASFRDTDGNVLVCDDQSLLEDSYQFTVSTS
jgi:hypothetical protein